LLQWANFNIWIFEVDDECGETLVLGEIPVGSGHDFANVGVMRTSGPHFLSGDNPLVAVFHSLGGE